MRRKVLHLIDSGGMYGAEAVVLSLMIEQTRAGLAPVLGSIATAGSPEKPVAAIARKKGLEVATFPVRRGPDIFGALRILRFARNLEIDLIHCHGYKANILMGLLPIHLRGAPYVVTLHGWTWATPFSRMSLYAWTDAAMARRANAAVVVSQAMAAHRRVAATGLQPVVVHNGIPEASDPDPQRRLSDILPIPQCSRGLLLGAIGRLSPEKGFDVLIEAVAKLHRSNPHIFLVIMGEGRMRSSLETLSRTLGTAGNVHFAGYIPSASNYLKSINIFVMSSRSEGLPITLLEAMRAGVPIVATRVGGIPEALDDGRCGVLVSPGDASQLAMAIQHLSDSPQLQKELLTAAKNRVAKEFSCERMERNYRDIYEALWSPRDRSARLEERAITSLK